ncbi:dienelactone hydrolase family protein [Nitzschia inconspicua]|uniref:Dienelactone hydrolase family protein n=1 Tax=Nitzschia inconspicua TaxID=303405 RepID=A0A9K3KE83_9STRA|nr:dienelactone hydrolase family protein [Nitzschia inconspicua]
MNNPSIQMDEEESDQSNKEKAVKNNNDNIVTMALEDAPKDVGKAPAAAASNDTSGINSTADNSVISSSNNATEKDEQQELQKKKKEERTAKKNLNEATLKALENYLKTGDFLNEPLEYEEVAAFNLKIHRYTEERTRMRQGLLFPDEAVKAENAEELLYNRVYQEEEFHAVGNEFFKNVLSDAHDMAGPSFIIHNKTCNWLKRAAGMNRNYDPYGQSKHQQLSLSDDSDDDGDTVVGDESSGAPRRVTRTRIRQSRRKRRQEKLEKETVGLRLLSEVAKELEKGQSKRFKAIEQKMRQERAIGLGDEPSTATDMIVEEEDDGDVGMRDADIPQIIGEEDSDQHQRVPKIKRLFPNLEPLDLFQLGPVNKFKDPIALAMLEWDELDRKNQVTPETCPDQPPVKEVPPEVATLGLELRPPRLELYERPLIYRGLQDSEQSPVTYPTSMYEASVKALTRALQKSKSRKWAIHEFFYSDIDREWYRKKDIVEDLVKLGFPVSCTTRMTRAEWSLVRRKIRKRPRLFCKRFILDQIKQRNQHRSLVRQLQQDPEIKEISSIAVGTTVTAYNKQYQTIRKGKIVLFDPKKFEYLVQFDTPEYGCELCPDSDVALVESPNCRSAVPPLYEKHEEFNRPLDDGTSELVLEGADEADPVTKQEMEREVLVTTLAVIKEAFDRKRTILRGLELTGESSHPKRQRYIDWLLSNLDRVNQSLRSALLHLQVMYGSAYATPPSLKAFQLYEAEQKRLPNKIPDDDSLKEWLDSLDATTEKLGDVVVQNSDGNNSPSTLPQNFSSCFNLLLLANHLTSSQGKSMSAEALDGALQVALDKFAHSSLPSTTETILVGRKLEQESRIEDAMKELGDAVGMLRAEATYYEALSK